MVKLPYRYYTNCLKESEFIFYLDAADCLPEDIDEGVQYVRELVTASELGQAEDNLVPRVPRQSCCQVSATFFRPLTPINLIIVTKLGSQNYLQLCEN
jgi:hypothetical protein